MQETMSSPICGEEVVRAENLRKTFTLSRKQQRLEHTSFTRKVAVDGLSFSAYRGEIYGLLGPNGAGKTTTLRILSTLIAPDSGDALVCGHSVLREPQKVRDVIGFMTSELKLEGFFTPSYLFDFFGAMHGVEKSVLAKRKGELFERFGIDRFARSRCATCPRVCCKKSPSSSPLYTIPPSSSLTNRQTDWTCSPPRSSSTSSPSSKAWERAFSSPRTSSRSSKNCATEWDHHRRKNGRGRKTRRRMRGKEPRDAFFDLYKCVKGETI